MKFLKFWFPVILYSGIIFWVSSLLNVKSPWPQWQLDKVFHALEYVPFGFLLGRAIGLRANLWAWIATISFLYGLGTEIYQIYVPGRQYELLDIVADTVGGIMGALIYQKYFTTTRDNN